MLCVRCSHTMPPHADRCARCFALNPGNHPPIAPVAFSFDDERKLPLVDAPVVRPVPPRNRASASPSARLLAWSLDGALICATAAACVAASLRVSHVRYPLDFVRDSAPLFGALFLTTSVAYSSLLTALCGRTAGMALAGHHLRTLSGQAPTASRALLHALLALPSAALGFFGFALALVDRRGQTLHDKLCRCITIVD